ncbi:MAG TPA: DinB family protein [Roseiflexaceae bacterium]|jgi:hypothetical protein|nr:DinB family protein [Roseiflexaceae bacterium]
MTQASNTIEVYLEQGTKRTFAGALEWPGWCRSGRDEAAALQAMIGSGPRYASVLHAAHIAFHAPADIAELTVVERLPGTTTTDFGAPDAAPSRDMQPFDQAEFERSEKLLRTYWQAFDRAAQAATGKQLRSGPRGGGRDLDKMTEHVLGSEQSYLRALGWKLQKHNPASLSEELERTRQAVLDALAAATHGELPERGPRGRVLWKPRYFVRRAAWHVLDHVWEIEDRVI